MLETIDIDLTGGSSMPAVTGAGSLRLLADRYAIAEGFGYDPASGAVEDARRLAGQRPLQFEAADTLPARWDGFDAAFSHEVLYLLRDLSSRGIAPTPRSCSCPSCTR